MTTATPHSNPGGRVSALNREDSRAPLWERCARSRRSPRAQTVVVMALALVVRLFVIARSHGMLDGDEAVLGIQAEQILHGAHPIYFSGQPYMGSWDAYLAAPLIALFGPSAFLLHAITATESLALIPLIGSLANRLYGKRTRFPAMLLAAVPPLFVASGELRMLGGYVETLVLGSALLLLTVELAHRYRDGRPTGKIWALAGALTGAGLWIDLLIVCYVVACALWISPVVVSYILGVQGPERLRRARQELRRLLLFALAALLGMTPAVMYALRNKFLNVTYFSAGNTSLGSAHPLRLGVLRYYVQIAVPRVLGGQRVPTWTPQASLPLSVCGIVALVAALGAFAYLLARIFLAARTLLTGSASTTRYPPRVWWNDALPLLLVLVVTVLFWRSPATGESALFSYADAASRYALPLTTVATLEISRSLCDFSSWITRRASAGGRLAGPRGTRLIASALLGMVVLAFAVPYLIVNQESVMQSPFAPGSRFPVGASPLLNYLSEQHISYIWTDHWYGNDIMYLTNQRVQCADYVDISIWNGVNRFPNIFQKIQTADRPSFLISSRESAGEPVVAKALDALHVTYTMARFGSLWVITPVSRTVLPSEIQQSLLEDHGP